MTKTSLEGLTKAQLMSDYPKAGLKLSMTKAAMIEKVQQSEKTPTTKRSVGGTPER